jgi:hypothetical protein
MIFQNSAVGRKQFINIAKAAGYTVRCVMMKTPRELCEHLNIVREVRENQVDVICFIVCVFFLTFSCLEIVIWNNQTCS